MGIDSITSIFTWYQHKISRYDKELWETKREQYEERINRLNYIKTRRARPDRDLIDVDLVRGSSYSKVKPKHGFIKVIKLATLRCILYPFYGYWWIEQTSKYVFFICLIIYMLQIINISIYCFLRSINNFSESFTSIEIIIPMLMLWILCLIHTQIVATNPELEKSRFKRQRTKLNGPLIFLTDPRKIRKIEKKNKVNKKLNGEIKNDDSHEKKKSVFDGTGDKCSSSSSENNTDAETEPSIHSKKLKTRSLPEAKQNQRSPGELTSSATDWMGVTTNSDCSCSSNLESSDCEFNKEIEIDKDSGAVYRPCDKVSCDIWDKYELKKADLSTFDICSVIIRNVHSMPENYDYFYVGISLSALLALLPLICKILNSSDSFAELQNLVVNIYTNISTSSQGVQDSLLKLHQSVFLEIILCTRKWILSTFDGSFWEHIIMVIASIQRLVLASMIFFLLAVAERTFKKRLLYAKLFSHLTSSRKAQKSQIPHFRLNKVINIKTWLSIRSYLKKRGPQRSIDVIVSTAFIINLMILMFLCVELLKETVLISQYYLEALVWCIGLGILLLRFMTLATKINQKFRNPSVLITEQLNLHLQIEQKPHKKDELNVANNVLKLAIDLLKELENPFTISGLSANPVLYNCTKLIILSALSAVFSEMLGFKLKLHKIKFK